MIKKTVPVKNIDQVLVDIKKPGFVYEKKVKFAKLNLKKGSFGFSSGRPRSRNVFKIVTSFVVIVFFLTATLAFFNFKTSKADIVDRSERIFSNFSDSLSALKDLKPDEATKNLEENSKELSFLTNFFQKSGSKTLLGALGGVVPQLKDAGSLLTGITKLNFNFLGISKILTDLKSNGFKYFQSDGGFLIKELDSLRGLVVDTNNEISSIKNKVSSLSEISSSFENFDRILGDQYLKYSSDINSSSNFLAHLVEFLSSEEIKHIAIFFQNPSEIRPAGGFIGSYGHLQIQKGQMVNLEVQDIYWPDHPMNFNLKIIPPEPLQSITKDWGARDANWFFDFPTSAKTVMGFLEKSKVYEEAGIKFDAAIALNINVLGSILKIIGPVEIEDYKLKIDNDNFLEILQREVEAGRDKKPGQNPKKILSVLSPIIIERLGNLNDTQKSELFEEFRGHIAHKDIMIFSKDSVFSSFFDEINLSGKVYDLPKNFWGSYLAVVNANIAGGKSDAFINQSIEARIDVDTDGGSFTDLTIERTHWGENEKDSWWRATNKDYIQIFTNPKSILSSIKGNSPKNPIPRYDYETEGYSPNEDVVLIEKTKISEKDAKSWNFDAFGKKVFATWFNTLLGKTSTLNLRYETLSDEENHVIGGKSFRFIYERQSGVKTKLKVVINAPFGYNWLESGSPVFIYEIDDPEKRIVFDLTPEKQ